MPIRHSIIIKGAKAHNLKNIDVNIPRDKLVAIVGVSGSGKSSLAFDVLHAEGRRRYLESLSLYAKQLLGMGEKPDVQKIEGISPSVAITPKKGARSPRSTVGTMTEIYDYLRLLYSKIGKPHCPNCKLPLSADTTSGIVKKIISIGSGESVMILSPVSNNKNKSLWEILGEIKRKGFLRVRINGEIYKTDSIPEETRNLENTAIDVVIDSFAMDSETDKKRIQDSVELALRFSGSRILAISGKKEYIFNKNFSCEKCKISIPEIEPRIFSFNNPIGACEECTGLGEKMEISKDLLMPNGNLTLDEGAIIPMSFQFCRERGKNWCEEIIRNFAKKYGFDTDIPVKDLPEKHIKVLLYGDKQLDGIIPAIEKKHKEKKSEGSSSEIENYMVKKICPKCQGLRLKPEILGISISDKSISELSRLPLSVLKDFLKDLLSKKTGFETPELYKISASIENQIISQIEILSLLSLNYLTLDRTSQSISGGEDQRIRLSSQISAKLNGILYVLDEPSVGLHPRDQEKLLKIMKELKELGNTVIVVEHDRETIKKADWVIEIGPGAGKNGGKVVYEGDVKKLLKAKTLTGDYLSGRKKIGSDMEAPAKNKGEKTKELEIFGASENNLKNINAKIPLEKFVCVTGVSGSGKSSLIDDILAKALLKKIFRAHDEPGKHEKITGIEFINKIVLVDQSPIGRTPRSNPATYTGAFTYMREIFANTKEAKLRNYSSGYFSFNAKGGRCEECEGQGQKKAEMYFLPDMYIKCSQCHGTRYKQEILDIDYQGKNISEVLDMTVEEAIKFFKDIPGLSSKLETLNGVGLSYITLGQSATSLSGGEAQRIKLATELSRKDTGKTLYILDEPTTGLHFDDIKKLISVLKNLVQKGNTVLCVEHNADLIKNSDWVIDLGPEGGEEGGYIVAQGTPNEIKKCKKSWTGRYLH